MENKEIIGLENLVKTLPLMEQFALSRYNDKLDVTKLEEIESLTVPYFFSIFCERADRSRILFALTTLLHQAIQINLLESRERDQALINLEQSLMWVNSSLKSEEI